MVKLYIPNPDVMSKDEIKALEEAKQKQIDRIDQQGMQKVEDYKESVVTVDLKTEVKSSRKGLRMRNPIDMYGNKIYAGQYINYPVRKGSNTYMRTAKVLNVRERNSHLDKPQMVLDVAVAIAPRHWERANNKNWEQDVEVRKVTVSCPYRATILPEDYVKSDRRYKVLTTI